MAYERRPTRSDRYQYLIAESIQDMSPNGVIANLYTNEQALYEPHRDEDIEDLDGYAFAKLSELIKNHFTPKQMEVWQLLYDGYTQDEIAGKLGLNQSSVT